MNRFGNICLDLSSFALVSFILSLSFFDSSRTVLFILGAFFLFVLCWCMLELALTETESHSVNFENIEEEDSKTFWVFSSVLFPILQGSCDLSLTKYTIMVLFFLIIYWRSISFIYNPVLLLMGYHYYKVSIGGKTFYLISKRKLMNPKDQITVGQLSSNLIIEKNGE